MWLTDISARTLSLKNKLKSKQKNILFYFFMFFYLFLSRILAENPFSENPIIWNENEQLLPPISMLQKWNTKWNRLNWVKAYLLREMKELSLSFIFLSLFFIIIAWQQAPVTQNNFIQAQKFNLFRSHSSHWELVYEHLDTLRSTKLGSIKFSLFSMIGCVSL